MPARRDNSIGNSGPWAEAIRQAIKDDPRTPTQVARDANVSTGLVSRFMRGERDLQLSTAQKLGDALGMVLAKP